MALDSLPSSWQGVRMVRQGRTVPGRWARLIFWGSAIGVVCGGAAACTAEPTRMDDIRGISGRGGAGASGHAGSGGGGRSGSASGGKAGRSASGGAGGKGGVGGKGG